MKIGIDIDDTITDTYKVLINLIAEKYNYANNNNMGIMCWAYTEDTSDTVINAIYEAKNK